MPPQFEFFRPLLRKALSMANQRTAGMIASPNNRAGSFHALKFEVITSQTASQKSALIILAIMRQPV
jgi:hypothetical protein